MTTREKVQPALKLICWEVGISLDSKQAEDIELILWNERNMQELETWEDVKTLIIERGQDNAKRTV